MKNSKQHEEDKYAVGGKWFLATVDPLFDKNGEITGCVHVLKDITESEGVKETLRKHMHRNEQVLKTMMDGFILADTEGQLIDVNPAYCKIIGYSYDELMEMNIRELEIKIPSEKIKERIEHMVTQGFDKFETVHRSKDGRSIDFDASIVIMNPDENPYVAAFVRDITKQKEIESALIKSQTDLSLIFDNVSDSIAFTHVGKDGKQKIIDVNKSFMREFDVTRDQLVGKTIDLVTTAEDYAYGEQKCAEAIKAKKPIKYVIEIDTPKGKVLFETDTIPIFNQTDECTHFLHVNRNITERVRAETALRKSEERYSSVVENSKDGILIHDDAVIKFVNSAMVELTGFSESEFIGSNILDYVAPEYLELARKRHTDRAAGKEVPSIYEIAIKKNDGSLLPVEVNVSLMNFESKPSVLVFVRDITVRKKAEELIKKSLQEKEVLLKEIHHRVKNNLQIISSLLRLQSQSLKDKDALEKFAVSQNRIKSMALIHESLYSSKDLSKVDFSEYIHSLIKHLSSIFDPSARNIDIKLDLEQIYFEIKTAIPLGLITNELVSNSLQHAFSDDGGGEIRIRLRREKTGGFSLLVKDSGIGFPKELDFQAVETLGMNIVSDLVMQINGTISLNREDGTEFIISV